MKYVLVIDVESIGLYGEPFAVAGTVIDAEEGRFMEDSFRFACDPDNAQGWMDDRAWVAANIPPIQINSPSSWHVERSFWFTWLELQKRYPGIVMAAECGWPVEASFLLRCIGRQEETRKDAAPYPLHEIASFMQAAGMDPMATYDRRPDELPKHCPLADARQSARLLLEALRIISDAKAGQSERQSI